MARGHLGLLMPKGLAVVRCVCSESVGSPLNRSPLSGGVADTPAMGWARGPRWVTGAGIGISGPCPLPWVAVSTLGVSRRA